MFAGNYLRSVRVLLLDGLEHQAVVAHGLCQMLLEAAIIFIDVAETKIAYPLNLREDARIGIREVPATGGVPNRCMEFVICIIHHLTVEGLSAFFERKEMNL